LKRVSDKSKAQGFTLIEMIAVLTIVALISGVAIPAMQRWFDSISERAQLTAVSVQFQRLSARTALLSQTLRLNRTNWKTKLADGEDVLALPDGWSLTSDKPVVFFYSGICEGGVIELLNPQKAIVKLNIAPLSCDVSILR